MSRLEEIEARCNAATPGPWTSADGLDTPDPDHWYNIGSIEASAGTACLYVTQDSAAFRTVNAPHRDAAFIAHARDDVPFLLAEVRRLQSERDALSARLATAMDLLRLAEQYTETEITKCIVAFLAGGKDDEHE